MRCSTGLVGRPSFTAAISWLMQKISTSLSWTVASPLTEGVISIVGRPVRVAQDAPVGPGRQREQRMLHGGHVVLGDAAQERRR